MPHKMPQSCPITHAPWVKLSPLWCSRKEKPFVRRVDEVARFRDTDRRTEGRHCDEDRDGVKTFQFSA